MCAGNNADRITTPNRVHIRTTVGALQPPGQGARRAALHVRPTVVAHQTESRVRSTCCLNATGSVGVRRGIGGAPIHFSKPRLRVSVASGGGALVPLASLCLVSLDAHANRETHREAVHRVDVALLGRLAVPHARGGVVLGNSLTVGVGDRQVVLSVGVAILGGESIEIDGGSLHREEEGSEWV